MVFKAFLIVIVGLFLLLFLLRLLTLAWDLGLLLFGLVNLIGCSRLGVELALLCALSLQLFIRRRSWRWVSLNDVVLLSPCS